MSLDTQQTTPQTVREWVYWVEAQFKKANLYYGHGTETALDEAAWLVATILKISSYDLNAFLDADVSSSQQQLIQKMVKQRVSEHKPLAYLLNEAWFAGLKFYVDERVIVPRSPFAECILNHFAPWLTINPVTRILDLGTGSGCMAIAAALAFPQASVDAVDVSADALAVAAINVEGYDLQKRVRLVQSDCFEQLAGCRYDIIMSNPPYVGQAEYDALPQEYHCEPRQALLAKDEGLAIVERILMQAHNYLSPEGILVIEVGNSEELMLQRFPNFAFVSLDLEYGGSGLLLLTQEQLHWASEQRSVDAKK